VNPTNIGIAPIGYHEQYYSDRDWQAYSEIIAKIIRHSKPGTILDLGAGCGYLVEAANQWGLSSIGLEGSTSGVEIAKRRSCDLDIRQHYLSETLPFEANTFQTVVFNQVVEHLEPDILCYALAEAFRVLKVGGMVLITSPSCFNKAEWKADPTHINLLSPSQLHKLLSNSGFEDINSFDSPLALLGKSRLGFLFSYAIFKLFKIERMSATANAIAFKLNAPSKLCHGKIVAQLSDLNIS
jgi:SAM-dependent methyltransferase